MRKLVILALALACLSPLALATVPVSVNVKDVATNALGTNVQMRFTLQNCGNHQPRVMGTAVLVKPQYTFKSVAGAISGTIYGNNEIDCGGGTPTYYTVDYFVDGKPVPNPKSYVINTGATFNPTTATPMGAGLPVRLVLNFQPYTQTFTAATTWTVTHNFNNSNVLVQCYDSSNQLIFPDTLVVTDANTVTMTWAVAQAGRVVVISLGNSQNAATIAKGDKGDVGPAGIVSANSGVVIDGATSGAVTIDAAAVTTNHTLTLPAANGSGALVNDGAGALSWAYPLAVKTNGTPTTSQSILNFTNANGFTWSADGSGGVTLGGSPVTLKHDGTSNGSQSILNMKHGSGITLADDGVGGVTITSTVGSHPSSNIVSVHGNGTTLTIVMVSSAGFVAGDTLVIQGSSFCNSGTGAYDIHADGSYSNLSVSNGTTVTVPSSAFNGPTYTATGPAAGACPAPSNTMGSACDTFCSGGSGGGTATALKTNGVDNGSQTTLNLKQGANITLSDDGVGGVTIAALAGSGSPTPWSSITNGTANVNVDVGAFDSVFKTSTSPLFTLSHSTDPVNSLVGQFSITNLKPYFSDNICHAAQASGANAGAQINQCISALPNGGTIDARGYGATTQAITASISLGSATAPITLLIDNSTTFNVTVTSGVTCPGSITAAIAVGPFSAIIGNGIRTSASGFVVQSSTNVGALICGLKDGSGLSRVDLEKFTAYQAGSTASLTAALVHLVDTTDNAVLRDLSLYRCIGIPCLLMTQDAGGGSGPVKLDNLTINQDEGQGLSGGGAGKAPLQLTGISGGGSEGGWLISGGSITHPSCVKSGGVCDGTTATPIVDISCVASGGSSGSIGTVTIVGTQIETSNTTDVGVRMTNCTNLTTIGVLATNAGAIGSTMYEFTESGGGAIQGATIMSSQNLTAFTHTIVDNPHSKTIDDFNIGLWTYVGTVNYTANDHWFAALLQLQSTPSFSCDATQRGTLQYIAGGTGVKDIVQVCAKDVADSYAWRSIY